MEERKQRLQDLATRLASAWKVAGRIGDISVLDLPGNRPEAYFVQDRMSEAIGEDLIGWKVGATSAKMRDLDGHDDVIPGRIFRSVAWSGNTHTLAASRFPGARVETEFAFRLSKDLPVRNGGWTVEELEPWVVLHPAIEIIGDRHDIAGAAKSLRSLMTIADNGGGIGFVFGDPVMDWQGIDFQSLEINLTVDDGKPAENFFGDMRCIPIVALVDLVNHLAERGFGLKAEDFISTGAATVPQHFGKGSHVKADFGQLGRIELKFE